MQAFESTEIQIERSSHFSLGTAESVTFGYGTCIQSYFIRDFGRYLSVDGRAEFQYRPVKAQVKEQQVCA
jgi:hypothetical protein